MQARFSAAMSADGGLRSRRTMSADASAARRSATISAPASRYSGSEKFTLAPMPASTATCAPRAVSFVTLAGTIATRRSEDSVSVGEKIRIGRFQCTMMPSRGNQKV
jgi:hypothetical protein